MSAHRFSLFKHSNGVYHILYYHNGRRRWKSTKATTKPEALRVLANFKELFEERLKSVSFDEFTEQFLASSDLSANTLRMYRTIFKTFTPFLRGAYVNEVTPEIIDSYKAKRLREISPVSVNVELRMLKAAFSTAKRWRMTEGNPFDGVTFARVPEQAPLALSTDDLQKLLACIREGWFRDIVLFAVMTGMRRGEIMNLRWSDVDFERRVVNVETNATWKTKHGKRRAVPLNETAVLLLRSRVGISPSEYVFTLNDRKISESWVSHLFKRYVRAAHLSNPRYRFHSLRHTTATNLLRAGESIHIVQRILGHSSVKVTEGYSGLVGAELHEAVNKISLPLN